MRLIAFSLCLAVSAAASQTLVVREEVCAALTALPADQNAAYVPGVDVGGRAVAPADLPASGGGTFDGIAVELTVELAKRFGIPADGSFVAEAALGYVTVRDGSAYLNGQKLADGSETALAALCRRDRRR